MKKTLFAGVVTFSLLGLTAPPALSATESGCAIQDTQCWYDFYNLDRPDYGWNKPSPIATPTPTPVPTEEPTEDNETVTDPIEEIEEVVEEVVTETVEELLDKEYFGGEEVIVQKTNGELVVGSVTPDEKADLEELSEVVFIEEDTPVTINYKSHWGTDRINQPALPLDEYYDGGTDGAGVRVYVIDTGVDHNYTSQFSSIEKTGFDYVGGDRYYSGTSAMIDNNPMDCHGHGTHVAGTVASKDYGVAPGATIVGVRVLSCSGSGSTAGVIQGIQWAVADAAGRPAVINMSLGGGAAA